MAGNHVRGALIAAALFTLTACGGGGTSTVATPTSSNAAAAFTGFAECAFPAGGPVTTAGLATVGPTLAVSWDTPATIPTADSSTLVTTVGPYRIGFERDGLKLSRYLFDSTTGVKTELTGPYTEAEQGISMVIPFFNIPELTKRVPWHATVSIDGEQVARCPETGTSKFGDRQPK